MKKVNGPDIGTGMLSMSRWEIQQKFSPFEVEACGLGFVCIGQGVFESVERPWFKHIVQESSSGSVQMLSEDLSFMMKVKAQGIPIFADPSVLVGHVKKMNVDW